MTGTFHEQKTPFSFTALQWPECKITAIYHKEPVMASEWLSIHSLPASTPLFPFNCYTSRFLKITAKKYFLYIFRFDAEMVQWKSCFHRFKMKQTITPHYPAAVPAPFYFSLFSLSIWRVLNQPLNNPCDCLISPIIYAGQPLQKAKTKVQRLYYQVSGWLITSVPFHMQCTSHASTCPDWWNGSQTWEKNPLVPTAPPIKTKAATHICNSCFPAIAR